jgi:hypothetical protein
MSGPLVWNKGAVFETLLNGLDGLLFGKAYISTETEGKVCLSKWDLLKYIVTIIDETLLG